MTIAEKLSNFNSVWHITLMCKILLLQTNGSVTHPCRASTYRDNAKGLKVEVLIQCFKLQACTTLLQPNESSSYVPKTHGKILKGIELKSRLGESTLYSSQMNRILTQMYSKLSMSSFDETIFASASYHCIGISYMQGHS